MELKKFSSLPPESKIFTRNTVAMYPNINTREGLAMTRAFIEDNNAELPKIYPMDIILNFIALVLWDNNFHFIYTRWKQDKGTVMDFSTKI